MKYRSVTLFLLFNLITFNVFSEQLTFVADNYCPYSCESNSEYNIEGYYIDLLRLVFEDENTEVKVYFMPWERAKLEVLKGRVNGIIALSRGELPQLLYTGKPVIQPQLCFYSNIDNPIKYNFSNLKKNKLGLVKGYGWETFSLFKDYFIEHQNTEHIQLISGDNAFIRNINRMLLGRVDSTLEDKNIARWLLKQNNLTTQVKETGCVDSGNGSYIGFSNKISVSKNLAKKFTRSLNLFTQDKTLEKLQHKYGF